MPELNKNIYDEIGRPSIRHHKLLCKLTEPIRLYFGIDRFWRNCHGKDGSYYLLGNHPPTAEIFFGQHLYQDHPYFRSPIFFQSGYILPELLHCHDYEKTQGRIRSDGNCYHVFILIRKYEHGFVEYGFATSQFQVGFEMVYLNHLKEINKFIDYFEIQSSKIIREAYECQINIAELIGRKYHERPPIGSQVLIPEKEINFLAAIKGEEEKAQAFLSLTRSEKACLNQYLLGKTAKEIAKKMHRSPRTIETHLANAKEKLGIHHRSALFDFLMPFRDLL